jgi:hypothetical protein
LTFETMSKEDSAGMRHIIGNRRRTQGEPVRPWQDGTVSCRD